MAYLYSRHVRRKVFKPVLPSRSRPESPYKQPDSHSLTSLQLFHIDVCSYCDQVLKSWKGTRNPCTAKAHPIHWILRFHQILKFSIVNQISFVLVWHCTGVQRSRVLRWSIDNGSPEHTHATSAPLSFKMRIKYLKTISNFTRFALLSIHHNLFLPVLDATSTYTDHADNANHDKFPSMAAESILSNLSHILAYLHRHFGMRSKRNSC